MKEKSNLYKNRVTWSICLLKTGFFKFMRMASLSYDLK